jgi:hypothetical protein
MHMGTHASLCPSKPATSFHERHPATISSLHALDRHGPLTIQPLRIPLMTLLLAILQALTLMILQQAMLAAEMPTAEAAVAYNPLRRILALLERAPDLLGRHAAAQGQRHVYCGVGPDGVASDRGRRRGEVFSCVHEAQVRGGGEVGAHGEEGAERGDGG